MVSQKPKYCKNFERNSHWRKLSMVMVWERYCNASPKPEFFLFSLFIFSFISQLIWVCLDWNFHRWFSIQKQENWCTNDPFSLKFCTSQHSYPVPLSHFIFLFSFSHQYLRYKGPYCHMVNLWSRNQTPKICKQYPTLASKWKKRKEKKLSLEMKTIPCAWNQTEQQEKLFWYKKTWN